MLKRPLFWLGLLLGTLAAFGTRRRWLPKPSHPSTYPLIDLITEAVVVCNTTGTVTYANAAAQSLFGPDSSGQARLCYPSGQRVPAGQLPLNRALRTGKVVEAAGYRYADPAGEVRVLDVTARPQPGGGAVATFRDCTALETIQAQETRAETRQKTLQSLCRRLCAAMDASALAQAAAESAVELLGGLPEASAEVFAYDRAAQMLMRLASMPETRVKPPKSLRESQPLTTAFDASLPQHWQIYVARQPYCDREAGKAIYALPLIAAGSPLGHLVVTCAVSAAFDDLELCSGLGTIASVAALALAGPQSAELAAQLATQVEALRLVVQAVALDTDEDMLADLMAAQIRQVIGAELCTVVMREGLGVRLLGNAYRDALLRPERHADDDPTLWDKAASKAMKTGKTVLKVGIANPTFDAGPWRAFAGQSGQHSVLAVPLSSGVGALTVYTDGATGFSETQTKFVETMAALFPATRREVSSDLPT